MSLSITLENDSLYYFDHSTYYFVRYYTCYNIQNDILIFNILILLKKKKKKKY